MKIRTERIFYNVSQELIDNAKIDLEAEKIIVKEGLRNEETGYLRETSYEFFKKNHAADLTVYKQNKKSGYSLIVLYKGVVRVGRADFMTSLGKEMEAGFAPAQDWPVYQLYELKKTVLCNLFEDPWDNRRKHEFKPSLEKLWEMIEKCIMV